MMLEKCNEKSNRSVTVVSDKCIYILRFEFSQKEPGNTENTTETCQKEVHVKSNVFILFLHYKDP